jgi:hypothetical protein
MVFLTEFDLDVTLHPPVISMSEPEPELDDDTADVCDTSDPTCGAGGGGDTYDECEATVGCETRPNECLTPTHPECKI